MTSPVFIDSGASAAGLKGYHEEVVKAAVKAGQADHYVNAAKSALAELQDVEYDGRSSDRGASAMDRPQLEAPQRGVNAENDGDTFTLLMAGLIKLLGEVSVTNLSARLEILRDAAQAAAAGYEALAQKYTNAATELETATNAVDTAQDNYDVAKARHDEATANLKIAEQALEQTEPGTPEHEAAQAAVKKAQGEVDAAGVQKSNAESEVETAIKVAAAAAQRSEEVAQQVMNAGPVGQGAGKEAMESELNAAATMILLMTKFAKMMGESSETKLEMERELFGKIQLARQEHMEKEAAEYAEQVAKAEAASKTMGCIGRIVGILVTVVSVAAAAVTGGASLALAGVGLALMVADIAVKEATGTSFMQKAMQPLMDGISKLAKEFAKLYTGALKLVGVDDAKAEELGQIFGTIAAAIAVVLAAVVATVLTKSAAGTKLGMSVLQKVGDVASDLTPGLLKQASQRLSQNMTTLLNKVGTNPELFASRMGMAGATVEIGGVAAQQTFAIKAAKAQEKAQYHYAEVVLEKAKAEAMNRFMREELLPHLMTTLEAKEKLIRLASDIQGGSANTALSMARSI